jgi:hypothetical protein
MFFPASRRLFFSPPFLAPKNDNKPLMARAILVSSLLTHLYKVTMTGSSGIFVNVETQNAIVRRQTIRKARKEKGRMEKGKAGRATKEGISDYPDGD